MSTGLILSGGGARAAYQVGVLRAVSDIIDIPRLNPFPVICGTSAGAINASLLACESDHFADSTKMLETLWLSLTSGKVHETGFGAVLASVGRLLRSVLRNEADLPAPWSLLDNEPLRDLLSNAIDFAHLDERFAAGDVESLAISALSYRDGRSLSFFQSKREIGAWDRHRRIGLPTDLRLDHLMASAAIPGIYPAVRIGFQYYGDGAVRQSAPLSPALHLGATRLFVIGVSHNPKEQLPAQPQMIVPDSPPTLAHMTSHFLNGPFIDALEEDLESLMRLNEIVRELSPEERQRLELKEVDVMCIAPSIRFDEIAGRHIDSLPRSMRFLMKTLGGTRAGGGASLASYLMFEAPFIRELIDCGYEDAMMQQQEIIDFLVPR